jgi:hypothetical protein
MLTVCPNCSTSSGVEIAILQSFSGWMRQARCRYCQLVWQAELSSADKLLLVADALAPAPPPIAAAPQVALEAPGASLQFGGSSTLALDEFEPGKDAWTPARWPAAMQAEPSADEHIAPEPGHDRAAMIGRGASRATSWRLPLPLSYLQLVVLGLAIADAAIIGWRADLVRAMPQTAGFYARLGLPVNVRGLRFDNFAVTTEWRDGAPVLVAKGAISNDTGKAEEVPRLHLVARNGEHQQVYAWAKPLARQALASGETMPFTSELTLPPLDTREIMVRFIDRDDNL